MSTIFNFKKGSKYNKNNKKRLKKLNFPFVNTEVKYQIQFQLNESNKALKIIYYYYTNMKYVYTYTYTITCIFL